MLQEMVGSLAVQDSISTPRCKVLPRWCIVRLSCASSTCRRSLRVLDVVEGRDPIIVLPRSSHCPCYRQLSSSQNPEPERAHAIPMEDPFNVIDLDQQY
jgi:hypothetical protein